VHWANPTNLEHEPAHHLPVLRRAVLVRVLLLLVVVVRQVQHNRARLKDSHFPVLQCWDFPIRVDREEPVLFLRVLADVYRLALVLQAELFELDGGLRTVGRAESVVDQVVVGWSGGHHCGYLSWFCFAESWSVEQ
jgi:hypothetical protein